MRRSLTVLVCVAVCLGGTGSALAGKPSKPGGGGGLPATTTTVSCAYANAYVGDAVDCAVTVIANSSTAYPDGDVSIAIASGTGSLNWSSCGLQYGSCPFAFTPTSPGSTVLKATYGGNANWGSSSGSFTVRATWHTGTGLTCAAGRAVAGASVSCSAFTRVTATGAAAPGSIALSTTGSGSLSTTSCASTSSCQFTYTTPASADTATITATFVGSSDYAPSSMSAVIESGKKDAALFVAPGYAASLLVDQACTPASLPKRVCQRLPLLTPGTPGECAARLTDATTGDPLPGRTLIFSGYCHGSVVTDSQGIATLQGRAVQPLRYCDLPCATVQTYAVSFAGDAEYFSIE